MATATPQNLPIVVKANGIKFELKDNGVQVFYTAKNGGITYDIIQNHGDSVWWVMAHKDTATLTLNRPGTTGTICPEAPYNQPGVLYKKGCHRKPVDYWINQLSDYIVQGKNPF